MLDRSIRKRKEKKLPRNSYRQSMEKALSRLDAVLSITFIKQNRTIWGSTFAV